MIRTTAPGEASPHARDRYRLVIIDDRHAHATRDLIDALESAPGARRQPLKLRMAKADLRSDTR